MRSPADPHKPNRIHPIALRARVALFVGFFVFGVNGSSWMARMPTVRSTFDLSEPQLGLLLTTMAVGSLVSVVFSGTIVAILGTRITMRLAGVLIFVALMTMAAALMLDMLGLFISALLIVGAAGPLVNIPLNVSASDVSRALEREIMPHFHGAFSAGAVAGSGLAAGAARLNIELAHQLLVVGVLGPVTMIVIARTATALSDQDELLPDSAIRAASADTPEQIDKPARRSNLEATKSSFQVWREPRTLTIGLLLLFSSMSEGTANAWLAIVVVDGVGASEATGALAVSVFTSAMMVGRFAGPGIIKRLGRPRTMVAIASMSIFGLILIIVIAPIWAVMVGVVAWGLGVSLSGPVALAAAADRKNGAAARVSVVTSFGSAGQLVTPPLLGRVAGAVGPRAMLWVVVGALLATIVLSPAVRPESSEKN